MSVYNLLCLINSFEFDREENLFSHHKENEDFFIHSKEVVVMHELTDVFSFP